MIPATPGPVADACAPDARASAPSLAERVRMALADAGYPNATVTDDAKPGILLGPNAADGQVPREVAWSAYQSACLSRARADCGTERGTG